MVTPSDVFFLDQFKPKLHLSCATTTITAENCVTGDQVTRYVYGTTLSNSDIARSDLLRAEIYPDSDDVASPLGNGTDNIYDRIEYKYNRQEQRTEMKDQNETIHAYDFDKLGRLMQDRVTALGSGVDGAVRRIATTYEVRGLREKVTSYDNAIVGSGSVVNEIVAEYNDLAMLVREYQEHDGSKNANTLYVGYNYDETIASSEYTKGLRSTSLRYPNGRLVHYTYGTSGSDAENLGRLDAIKDDNAGAPDNALTSYTYLGLGTVVIQDYVEPQVKLDFFGGASGTYAGFDRYDRVVDQRWYDYGSSQDVDRFKYGYDRASNRIWKENVVAANNGKEFDEFYTYDGVHRLRTFDRGDLNATKTGIGGTPATEEDWALDFLGNWSRHIGKTSGTTNLDQSRVTNKVNEITDIGESVGPPWLTPAYSRAGNMTIIPKPADPTVAFTATYDAWNRLVKIDEGGNSVAEYAFDGAKRRTVKKTYVGGVLDETRHVYLSEPSRWQVLEERLGSSSDSQCQFVWGMRFVDELILRDRDTDASASFDERLYSLQDANWNVTALADENSVVRERFVYSPYGNTFILSSLFLSRTISDFDWGFTFATYISERPTGLMHIRHRDFSSGVSWIQRDSNTLSDNNLYRYLLNQPISFTDPTGEGPLVVVVIILGVAIIISIPGDYYQNVPPPPGPKYKTPGYGNYCGPRCGRPGLPSPTHDCVDAACKRHDSCLATADDWLDWEKKKKCELALCLEVYYCDCSKSPTPIACNITKELIVKYACGSYEAQKILEYLGTAF